MNENTTTSVEKKKTLVYCMYCTDEQSGLHTSKASQLELSATKPCKRHTPNYDDGSPYNAVVYGLNEKVVFVNARTDMRCYVSCCRNTLDSPA